MSKLPLMKSYREETSNCLILPENKRKIFRFVNMSSAKLPIKPKSQALVDEFFIFSVQLLWINKLEYLNCSRRDPRLTVRVPKSSPTNYVFFRQDVTDHIWFPDVYIDGIQVRLDERFWKKDTFDTSHSYDMDSNNDTWLISRTSRHPILSGGFIVYPESIMLINKVSGVLFIWKFSFTWHFPYIAYSCCC